MSSGTPKMHAAEFDKALLPLLQASRAMAALDIKALTPRQVECAKIIAKSLTTITGEFTERLTPTTPSAPAGGYPVKVTRPYIRPQNRG